MKIMKERRKITRVMVTLLVCVLIAALPGVAAGDTGEENLTPTGLDVNESWVPGETVLILYYGEVAVGTVTDPAGNEHDILFTYEDGISRAEFPLLEDVIIGEYTVSAGGETAIFCVGCCAINAWYVDGWVNGSISVSLRTGEPVVYTCGDISGEIFPDTEDGTFAIPVDLAPGVHSMTLQCGNAVTTLVFTVDEGDGMPSSGTLGETGPVLQGSEMTDTVTVTGIVYEDLVVTDVDRGLDAPIGGAVVRLFADDGDFAFDPSADTYIESTTTGPDGEYTFTGLDAGSDYFLAVQASSLDTTRGREPGVGPEDILAEQTYQVSFDRTTGTHAFALRFGGQDPLVTDDWDEDVYEHVALLNASAYAGESMDFGFSYDVIVNDIPTGDRHQGSLYQFLTNAENIEGFQESRFVMAVAPNTHDGTGQWWKLDLTYRIMHFDGPFGLNGTVFDTSLSPWDTNPGYVSYNPANHLMVVVSTPEEVPIGTGPDGREYSGDEESFIPVAKPEIELNPPKGDGLMELDSAGSYVSDIAGYAAGTVISSLAPDVVIERCLIGMTANATPAEEEYATSKDSPANGIHFNKDAANNAVRNSVIAYTKHTAITLLDGADGCQLENILVYKTAMDPTGGHTAIDVVASDLHIDRSIISHTDENDAILIQLPGTGGGTGPDISNSLVEMNEGVGIGILQAPDTTVRSSVIRQNGQSGIVVESHQSTGNTFTRNAIYNNSYLGIDLGVTGGVDNVTINDGVLLENKPNRGMDYPVITAAVWNTVAGTLTIQGFVGLPDHDNSDFAWSEIEVFLVQTETAGDNLIGNNWEKKKEMDTYYGEGWMYLGTTTADSDGNFSAVIDVAGISPGTDFLLSGTATLFDGCTSEFGEVHYYNGGLPDETRVVTASITLSGTMVLLNITSHNGTIPQASLYWLKPDGMTIDAMSGDYFLNTSVGNEFTWYFNNLEDGVPQTVVLNFGLGPLDTWRISDLYNLGVDPR